MVFHSRFSTFWLPKFPTLFVGLLLLCLSPHILCCLINHTASRVWRARVCVSDAGFTDEDHQYTHSSSDRGYYPMAEDTFFRSYLMLSRQVRAWVYVRLSETRGTVISIKNMLMPVN
jgi:hypothetical protein